MGLGMSALRGEADEDQRPSERPLIAKSGPKDERWKSEDRPYGIHFFSTPRVLLYSLTFQQLEPLNQVSEIDDEV